jgi:hypothetical protein
MLISVAHNACDPVPCPLILVTHNGAEHGTDQLIDATMPRALHADACRDHALVAWVVLWDLPAYPDRYAARLAMSGEPPSHYLLIKSICISFTSNCIDLAKNALHRPVDLG